MYKRQVVALVTVGNGFHESGVAHVACPDDGQHLVLLFHKALGLGQHNDCLLYTSLGYADLILNGDPEEYLKNVAGSHGLED